MGKFIPYDKLSKKQRKKIDSLQRLPIGGPSKEHLLKTKYNRKKMRKETKEVMKETSFCFCQK